MMFGICSRCSAGIMPTTQDRYTGRQCPDRSYTLGAEHTAELLYKSGTGNFEGQEFDTDISEVCWITQKILWSALLVAWLCSNTIGLDEETIRKYVRWQQQKDYEEDASQLRLPLE